MKSDIKNTMTAGEGGYAMLFAVLISSVLLSIGLSIFNLTVKELTLSSSGRESQFSFYAADTGAECALYWDFKATNAVMFATSSGSQSGAWRDTYINNNNPNCVGASIANELKNPISVGALTGTTQFSLNIPNTNPLYCVVVTVTKTLPEQNGVVATVIDSRGYNTPCIDTTNPNRVERALKVTY